MFSVHMMASVADAIQRLGVQVEYIPAGCTSLVQPVNVGYNKAFKAQMRAEYTEWMLGQDPDKPIPTTSRRQLAEWIIAAQKNVGAEMIRMPGGRRGCLITPSNICITY